MPRPHRPKPGKLVLRSAHVAPGQRQTAIVIAASRQPLEGCKADIEQIATQTDELAIDEGAHLGGRAAQRRADRNVVIAKPVDPIVLTPQLGDRVIVTGNETVINGRADVERNALYIFVFAPAFDVATCVRQHAVRPLQIPMMGLVERIVPSLPCIPAVAKSLPEVITVRSGRLGINGLDPTRPIRYRPLKKEVEFQPALVGMGDPEHMGSIVLLNSYEGRVLEILRDVIAYATDRKIPPPQKRRLRFRTSHFAKAMPPEA